MLQAGGRPARSRQPGRPYASSRGLRLHARRPTPRADRGRRVSDLVRVLVVASDSADRERLRSLLRDQVGVTVVGEATGPIDLAQHATLRPEAVVVDGHGLEISAIIAAASGLELPLVTVGTSRVDAPGLSGFGQLGRGTEGAALAAAIRAASAGLVVVDQTPAADPNDGPLSAREREVLQLIAEGLPNKQIALRLGISPHTAKFHVAGLLQKLHAASRAEAVSAGVRQGLVAL